MLSDRSRSTLKLPVDLTGKTDAIIMQQLRLLIKSDNYRLRSRIYISDRIFYPG
jgi:hypothetical protein